MIVWSQINECGTWRILAVFVQLSVDMLIFMAVENNPTKYWSQVALIHTLQYFWYKNVYHTK